MQDINYSPPVTHRPCHVRLPNLLLTRHYYYVSIYLYKSSFVSFFAGAGCVGCGCVVAGAGAVSVFAASCVVGTSRACSAGASLTFAGGAGAGAEGAGAWEADEGVGAEGAAIVPVGTDSGACCGSGGNWAFAGGDVGGRYAGWGACGGVAVPCDGVAVPEIDCAPTTTPSFGTLAA